MRALWRATDGDQRQPGGRRHSALDTTEDGYKRVEETVLRRCGHRAPDDPVLNPPRNDAEQIKVVLVLNRKSRLSHLRVELLAGIPAEVVIDRIHRPVKPLVHGGQEANATAGDQRVPHVAEGMDVVLDMLEHVQADGGVQLSVAKLEEGGRGNVDVVRLVRLTGKALAGIGQLLRNNIDANNELTVHIVLRDIADGAPDIKNSLAQKWCDLGIDPAVVVVGVLT